MLRNNILIKSLHTRRALDTRRLLGSTQLRNFADKLPDYKTTVNVADIKVRIYIYMLSTI